MHLLFEVKETTENFSRIVLTIHLCYNSVKFHCIFRVVLLCCQSFLAWEFSLMGHQKSGFGGAMSIISSRKWTPHSVCSIVRCTTTSLVLRTIILSTMRLPHADSSSRSNWNLATFLEQLVRCSFHYLLFFSFGVSQEQRFSRTFTIKPRQNFDWKESLKTLVSFVQFQCNISPFTGQTWKFCSLLQDGSRQQTSRICSAVRKTWRHCSLRSKNWMHCYGFFMPLHKSFCSNIPISNEKKSFRRNLQPEIRRYNGQPMGLTSLW